MNEQVARFHVIYNERYKFDHYMEINKKEPYVHLFYCDRGPWGLSFAIFFFTQTYRQECLVTTCLYTMYIITLVLK